MAGKSYIKVGAYDWDRIKKMYIKTGGQTWSAVRKSYVKTSTGWRKVFDTASNRPFISGNDIPKIRLNTFRTGSSYNPTGTLDDPVDPVVEAPPVQQMGPSWTSPTYGWPYESLGRHLWGYDGTWVSGNGTSMTFVYTWLYNLTGNSNDNTAELNATSTTGRTDMLTNLSSHLGQSDGDYFDKNFLTFRVTATNSAGNASAESAPVYIVREVPTGSITMVSPGTAFTNSSMSATFTYSNNWYNKTDVSNSYIEWFAVSNLGDALTSNNRVEIQNLSSIAVTGTTSKSGTTSHVPTLANRYYYVKMTLNNSGTQNAVIAINGFTPKSPTTAQANKTALTSAALTAPTISSITYNGSSVSINFSGGSGPYYELYWSNSPNAADGLLTNYYDAASTSSPLTESISIPAGATRYFWLRSSSVNRGNTTASGNAADGTFGPWASSGFAFTAPSLTGATSTSIVSVSRLNSTQTRAIVSSSGASGPYYQLYWISSSTAPTSANYDAASTTSTVTEDYEFSNGITYYFYIRSSSENLGNITTNGTATAGTFSAYGPTTGSASYTFAQPSGSVSVSPGSGTAGTTEFTATASVSAAPSAEISYQWQYNDQGSLWLGAPGTNTNSTYTPPSNYVSIYGSLLRCQITANNGVGTQLVTTAAVTVAAALTKLATPTGVDATDTRTDGVNVTWNAVSGAAYYGVWYGGAPGYDSNPDFGGPNNPTIITGTSYLDTAISAGSSRDYYVQAFRTNNPAGTKSDWGGPNNGTRITAPVKLSTPNGVNASDNRTDGINITWNAVSGASYYGIWWGGVPGYDNAPDFGGPNNAGGWNGFGTSFLDTAVGAGTTRNYYVQAYASGNPTGTKSDWSAGDSGTRTTAVSPPGAPTSVNTSVSGLVTWSSPGGTITAYTVEYYVASSSGGANASGPYYGFPGTQTSFQISYPTVGGILLNYARARVSASNSGGTGSYSGFDPASGYR